MCPERSRGYLSLKEKRIRGLIDFYMENAKIMKNKPKNGIKVGGGDNAPYIWIKVPDQMTSWNFDFLLQKSVVGIP